MSIAPTTRENYLRTCAVLAALKAGERAMINPAPQPPDFTMSGVRPTDRFRIRSVWFFFVVIERLWQHRDGTAKWKRVVWSPVEFDGEIQ